MRRMLAGLVALGAAGCAAGVGSAVPPQVSAAVGRDFTLSPGQTARVEGEALTVAFLRVVEDSRCPRGVQCVRAGEAKVELDLRLEDRVEGAVVSTAGEPRAASLGPFDVTLVALDPLPTRAGPPRRYTATLRVTRR